MAAASSFLVIKLQVRESRLKESSLISEGHEMLKAQYNFEATLAKTLSFNEGDYFILHQSINKQRNWWQVVNIQGQLGFVPSNYVSPVKVSATYFQYCSGEGPPFSIETLFQMVLALYSCTPSILPHFLQPRNVPQLMKP